MTCRTIRKTHNMAYQYRVCPLATSLQGKTLFITGASRGIDVAITKRAARDAAYGVLTNSAFETGNFYIDDAVLAAHGITDLDAYTVTPGNENFLPDFFVD